jgi:hypothetical protein
MIICSGVTAIPCPKEAVAASISFIFPAQRLSILPGLSEPSSMPVRSPKPKALT